MNINKIAELAGVSRTTISRYLNNGYVSVESREKIKKVLAIVSNLLYSIRCTIVVQWHFYAIF